MRSRTLILAVVAIVVAAAIVIGVVTVASAGSSEKLPAVSAPGLLVKMAQAQGKSQAISGEVSWRNALFGNLVNPGSQFGMPAQNPLLASGSGRVWMSKDGVRIESQGSGGDQVVVASAAGHDAWVYDYAAGTARHVMVTGAPPRAGAPIPSGSPATLSPFVASALLQRLAPLGTMKVTGQTTVAGRAAYVLTFRPAASSTAVGSVQAAIDGTTFIPLRLQVFSKGGKDPALESGFTSVSFGPIAASRFSFTPPKGTRVTTQTVDAAAARSQAKSHEKQLRSQAGKALAGGKLQRVFLDQSQAAKLVPFKLVSAASSSTRPFRAAFVFKHGVPVSALGAPLFDLSGIGGMSGGASGTGGNAGGPAQAGPAVVQVYGSGLGSIVLAQLPASGQAQSQLRQLPDVFGKTTVNGQRAALVTTQLGGVAVWQEGKTLVVAAGLVPAADLRAFVSSVR